MSIYLTYVGKDKGTIPGVPARNLTREEAEQFGVAELLKSGLYVIKKDLSEMNVIYPNVEEEPRRVPRTRRRKE